MRSDRKLRKTDKSSGPGRIEGDRLQDNKIMLGKLCFSMHSICTFISRVFPIYVNCLYIVRPGSTEPASKHSSFLPPISEEELESASRSAFRIVKEQFKSLVLFEYN
jgi:hypothetical protein